MVLKLTEIELTISKMDDHYDANFGSWIRNEKNAAMIGHHLSKYIDDYHCSDFIVVLKWIVRSWTLRSIIILSRNMLNDIKTLPNSRKKHPKPFKNRVCILAGLIYTWNILFISEFLLSFLKNYDESQKCKIIVNIFCYFERQRIDEIINSIDNRVEADVINRVRRVESARNNKSLKKEFKKGLEEAFMIN